MLRGTGFSRPAAVPAGKRRMAKVLIISANRERVNMVTWPLGAASVVQALRAAGHRADMIDLMREESPAAAIDRAVNDVRPDVIGVSVRNIDDQSMSAPVFYLDEVRGVVDLCKNRSAAPIVIGGAGYSIFPQASLEYLGAGMGLPGGGEASFPQLVDRLCSGSGPEGPYLLHRPGLPPSGAPPASDGLDAYPLPDPEDIPGEYRTDDRFWMPVQTRRGCAMNCSYCSTPAIEGTALRYRSPIAVARWMRDIRETGVRRFYFVDNTFNIPPGYAEELCIEVERACPGIEWRCILYPSGIDDRMAGLMARAGCVEAALGFESGDTGILRAMNKRFTPDQVRLSTEALARHGIRRMGFLMLGGPGETAESAQHSIEFARSLGLEGGKISVGIRIYPGTPLAAAAVGEGIIGPNDDLLRPRFYLAPESGELDASALDDLEGWM